MSTTESRPILEPQDLIQAIDFALDFFNRAYQNHALRQDTYNALVKYYHDQRDRVVGHRPTDDLRLRPRDQCWNCKARFQPRYSVCPTCGVPVQGERVDHLRNLVFLCFEIKKHESDGRIPLSAAHAFLADSNGRIAALRRKLEQERAPLALAPTEEPPKKAPVVLEPADQPQPPPVRSKKKREDAQTRQQPLPRRSFLEILLDPRSIQWLLASGGVLLALGLILWLRARDCSTTSCLWPA